MSTLDSNPWSPTQRVQSFYPFDHDVGDRCDDCSFTPSNLLIYSSVAYRNVFHYKNFHIHIIKKYSKSVSQSGFHFIFYPFLFTEDYKLLHFWQDMRIINFFIHILTKSLKVSVSKRLMDASSESFCRLYRPQQDSDAASISLLETLTKQAQFML